MATLRKGSCYSKMQRAYTRRSKVKSKAYIKSMPYTKIVRFEMGDLKGNFGYTINLISDQDIQLRDNALESARLIVSRDLQNTIGNRNFHFRVMVYPHHALREKRQLTGAGADRMSQGMSQAFGKVTSRAAQVKKGKSIFTIYVNQNSLENAKKSLRKAIPRLPGIYDLVVKKLI